MIIYSDSDDDDNDYEIAEQGKQTSLLKLEYSSCAQYIIIGFIIESICQFILVTYLIMNCTILPKVRIYLSFFICHQFFLLIYQVVLFQNHQLIREQLLRDMVQNIPSRLNRQQNPLKGKYWDTCHQTLLFMELISFSLGQIVCEKSNYGIPYYIFLLQHIGTFFIFISIFIVIIIFAIKTFDCQDREDTMTEEDLALQPNNIFISIKHRKVTAVEAQLENQCPICLQLYQNDEEIIELDCNIEKPHFFHKECFSYWASKHNTCPLCRKMFT